MPPTATVLPRNPLGPHDVRALPTGQLAALAQDIRTFLIEKVCATGGHLGPNLGVVELTIALHRVFDSPRDALLFDTGHQSYVHKILTGRAADFDRLRQAGGLSGYPSRAESAHDWSENSHASTSLSYADGLAKAHELRGHRDRSVVAVIGDGAMTGGMAWEALNNIGAAGRPVVVVLNDNGRSYAPTTGALTNQLHALKHPSATARDQAGENLFTRIGFTYLGPVDGHDTGALEAVLDRARLLRRPVLVHAVTVKGSGFAPAEDDEADCLHAVGTVDAVTGRPAAAPAASGPPAVSWTGVFGRALLELAGEREDLVAITASMLRPTGLHPMAVKYPDRVFDVGIAEQHAVTSAAGLAMGGFHPVVALYSTFLTRAVDQVLMDVALHRLPVTFVLDRAGVTGPDGASHHGMWDASLLGIVPGLRLAVPRDSGQLRSLLREATAHEGPTALRFPKGTAGQDLEAVRRTGSVDVLSASGMRDVLLVSYGPMAPLCLQAATLLTERGIGVTVADPRWAIPVAPELLELASRHRLVVTVEDNSRTGGVGSTLAQTARDHAITTPVHNLGLPRAFLTHGPREQLLADAGLTAERIAGAVLRARAGKPLAHTAPTDGIPR
ncbi:1-deoxy-D-xylulose-5-phosphate synthase [Streptomyces sp. NPDC006638]|uniref:1-deoxy-D-xylulose-5-phosphate synthase n=1 Tax=Streptomyces sp. NPDC006638 TaxID=3157183 RepID=UPI0033A214F7